MSYIAIDSVKSKDAEKNKNQALKESLDILQNKSTENRVFFDLVRQLITARTEQERAVLREELRGFVFTTTTTTTSIPKRTTSLGTSQTTTTILPTASTQSTSITSTTTTTAPKPSTTDPKTTDPALLPATGFTLPNQICTPTVRLLGQCK